MRLFRLRLEKCGWSNSRCLCETKTAVAAAAAAAADVDDDADESEERRMQSAQRWQTDGRRRHRYRRVALLDSEMASADSLPQPLNRPLQKIIFNVLIFKFDTQ